MPGKVGHALYNVQRQFHQYRRLATEVGSVPEGQGNSSALFSTPFLSFLMQSLCSPIHQKQSANGLNQGF